MHYNELIKLLQNNYDIQVLQAKENSPVIKDIRLLGGSRRYWNQNTLYVGSLDRSEELPDIPVMLILVDKPLNLPEGSYCSYIRCGEIYDLFNEAKDLIFEDLSIESIFFELAQMALNEESISRVINRAATLLGDALVLVDSGQRVLAYSSNFNIEDPLWAQNIEKGYCSYEFVQKVRSNKGMKEWSKQGSDTKLITLTGDWQQKLVARITQGGQVIGALIMIEHHTPFRQNHMRLLPMVGRLLFDVFSRDSFSEEIQGSFHSVILYNLLDSVDSSNTLEYIAMSGIDFPAEMRVVVARFVRHIKNRYLKRTFCMELEQIFPQGYTVKYKNYIGILVPSVSEKQKNELAKLANNEDVSIGISWTFVNIAEFKRHFYQAAASIKLAHRFGWVRQVFDYSDFSFYDLLDNYSGKKPLEHYCHPALKVLRDYDRTNNTEFYLTLRTYLEHNKNLRATAGALYIHRNTLIYRINRINQLIKLNLDNINIIYSLIDSFRIETFLKD